jgi:hypothetical protein
MAYRKITWGNLNDNFGITAQRKKIFYATPNIQPSAWLIQAIERGLQSPLMSEKARSESLVYPILTDLLELNKDTITLYSGAELNADKKNGLNGECDFLLGQVPHAVSLDAPLFTAVEAKKADIDLGLAQCAAQMLGIRIFNQKKEKPTPTVYGCVTTGSDWQFLLLQDKVVWVDTDLYYLGELPKLLGILQTIVDKAK